MVNGETKFMKRVEAVLRAELVHAVKEHLKEMGVTGGVIIHASAWYK
jgi:nitrogen regulatory protein PII